ncbi:MAG: T9SS type A sorting domain-containing protein [Ignavibacteriae bacterium]|nr:T9SS type A sorting domain-containing protein [Ignavibacteriota bacterium]
MALNRGTLRIAVLSASLNGKGVAFVSMSDTTRIGLSRFESVLSTEPFAGNGNLQLRILFSLKGQSLNGVGMRLVLRDANTGQLVANLKTFNVGDDALRTFDIPLNYGNRQVKLVLQPIGVGNPKRIDLDRWYVVESATEAPLAKNSSASTSLNNVPEVFAVHPNYPNPFNPSTQIKFDLPAASHVTLAVYDVLGRKVAELVNGQVAEGYHTATWNASDVASGVYFARFSATNASGAVKLNKVTKLLLTK